jgi:integrase
LVCAYRGSPDYLRLAASTRRPEHFGDLRIRQFDRTDKIRPVIRQWRNRYASTPRTADFGLQVLSRVLSFAVDPLCRIERNPCEGIKQLYRGGNRSEIIWTDEDIAQLKASSSLEIAAAVDLASHAGLRLGDLLRLCWSHVGDDAIRMATSKSGGERHAIVPLYRALRSVLANIPKRSITVLTNQKGAPWTVDGFGSSFNKAKLRAGLADRDLHFHDLRGTAATRFYVAGISERAIAEIMGWEEDHVGRIIRRYVSRSAATEQVIQLLNRTERRTGVAKPATKPAQG